MSNDNANRFRLAKLPYHVKLALLGAGLSSNAMAQTDAAADIEEDSNEELLDEVVVTGVRGSLLSSQLLRRNSEVIVDAVTAADIGTLPDRSVNEVLQRIPGVAISRFAGSSDPDHFSVEGSGTIVRGLTFVRSEVNGRDVFTADSGQALGFNTVSPELMQSVQVFKNQSADMIEGGIGGTVNLVTKKPFDSQGNVLAFSTEMNYSDHIEEWTPGASGLASGRWVLPSGGEFGALVSVAYSDLESRSDGTLVAEWLDRGTGQYIPSGAGIRTQEFDRERLGYSGALQWANADDTMEATFEFFRSTYENRWNEHAIEPSIDDSPNIVPRTGSSFTFGSDNLFQTGVISQDTGGWRSNEPTHPLTGVRQLALVREQYNESTTEDYALNLKFTPADNWRAQFEVQRVESDVDVTDYTVHGAFFADMDLDTTSDIPQVIYVTPEDAGNQTDYFEDPATYYLRSAMDHLQDNDGEETAVRADVEFDFSGDGFADSVRFGVRYSEREQTVRYTTYNWGNMSATWNQPWLLSSAPEGMFQPYNFEDYHRGDAPGISGVPFYAGPLNAGALRDLASLVGPSSWVPVQDRGAAGADGFLPSEVYDTDQDTTAAYVRLDFGHDFDNGMSLDGNVGVRYVETDQESKGFINYPSYDQWLGGVTLAERCTVAPGETPPGFCSLDPADQASYAAWADGSGETLDDKHDFDNVLPSLNLRLNLNDDHVLRFSYSESISRPDFGSLKSYFDIDFGDDDPVTGEWLGPDSETGNTRLEPIESTNIDVAWEWYYDEVGSLTLTYFHKDLDNYIVPAVYPRPFENNGEVWDVAVTGIDNSPDDGTIEGFEIGYQQIYDMLPGYLQYLGVQANYTYIDASGLPIVGTKSDEPTGAGDTPIFDVSDLSLPGLSEDTFNLVTFWENDVVSARLAYNYRSEYTLTTYDVIYPFTPILHESTSQLDGSIFWRFRENMEVGVQGVNLTDEVTETRSVYNQNLEHASRSYFMNDRRYAVIFRGTF